MHSTALIRLVYRRKSQHKTSGRTTLLATLLFVTSVNCGVPGSTINTPISGICYDLILVSILLYFLSASCNCCVIKCGYSSGDNNINKQWTLSVFTKLPEDNNQSVSEIRFLTTTNCCGSLKSIVH